MDAFVYQAALLCQDCANETRTRLEERFGRDMKCEDSDHWPQGPHANGGGEADTPQHCDKCRVFLENSLTGDGDRYVRERLAAYISPDDKELGEHEAARMVADRVEDDGGSPALAEWARFYTHLFA